MRLKNILDLTSNWLYYGNRLEQIFINVLDAWFEAVIEKVKFFKKF